LPDEHTLETILGALPEYRVSFEKVCSKPCKLSTDTVAKAIASYERSLLSGDSAFDRYYYGHEATALSARARNGLGLFTGRAGCAQCHTITASDALLTDQQFHPSALPMRAAVFENLPELTARVRELRASQDPSALNGLIASDARVAALGRFLVTANPADINSYQTPSLRNVALTAPYMHDGSVGTLREAVELELYRRSTNLEKPIVLTLEEQEDIVNFLRALTGKYRGAADRVAAADRPHAPISAAADLRSR
jgi:cytochrome c peroxidase